MDHSDIDISDLLADDEDDHFRLSDVIPSIHSTPPHPVIIEDRSFLSDISRPLPRQTQSKGRKRPSTAKPKRSVRGKASSKKSKVRSRPQSHRLYVTKSNSNSKSQCLQSAIRRFEQLQTRKEAEWQRMEHAMPALLGY